MSITVIYHALSLTTVTDIVESGVKHLNLRVECTLFCNLQSWAQTHAVLVISLYELLISIMCQSGAAILHADCCVNELAL